MPANDNTANLDLLGKKPFYLEEADVQWVARTLAGMTEADKIGQLFCLIAYDGDEDQLKRYGSYYKAGGVMLRPMPFEENQKTVDALRRHSEIPMLIAANLERGGNGVVAEGTCFGSPLQVAATDDPGMAYRLGWICGREGAAAGVNWSFAPIIDIDYNFRNPITNVRTFGSDPARVEAMSVQYIKAVQELGMAACIKHFPGDGVDERDQHLVTSVNSFSCERWDETFGKIYRACIDAGAMTVMVGHLMLPAYVRKLRPDIQDRDMLPASLSYELTTGLLKRRLGFDGLVVTDATTMAGLAIAMPRSQMVPQTIAAGCDMFLFARSLEEDFGYMKKGVKDGVITPSRLDEAVTKILALKAALGLNKAPGAAIGVSPAGREAIGAQKHRVWSEECADKGITLVKEEPGVLPISPAKYRKVLFYDIESQQGFAYSAKIGACQEFLTLLEANGFVIDRYEPKPGFEGLLSPASDVLGKYDLIIYVANMCTKSNQTVVRIEWAQPMGANVPTFVTSIPTIFISIENPYHLLDVPRVRTYINTYGANGATLAALVDKLMGRSSFKGVNPVDPFCGMWDTRL